MANCSHCGAETQLFDCGVPICPSCDAKPQSERERVASILRIRLEAARIRRFVVEKTLDEIMAEQPGIVPAPDGVLRIQKTGRESQEAAKAVNLAIRELNNFLLYGNIPPDLDTRKDSVREQRKPAKGQAG